MIFYVVEVVDVVDPVIWIVVVQDILIIVCSVVATGNMISCITIQIELI